MDSTKPASRSTRRCLDTIGCGMPSCRSISPTDCCDETRRLNIARRFGSAMISNTDSILLVYSTEHIRVKVYTSRGQATPAEVGFDSLEWLLFTHDSARSSRHMPSGDGQILRNLRSHRMTAADFRRIALNLEGVEEYSHAGLPAFRVGGRKFASLASQVRGYGNLM